jgi:hypothetical protein
MTRLLSSFALLFSCALPLLQLRAADAAAPKTITPGDNLVIDGIPPIPADLVDEVAPYTEARAATFQDWHPSRPEMLITTRFGDTNQIHKVLQPGGARSQLTFFPDRVDEGSYETTKGDFFVFTKGAGGNEFTQNYRYEFATGAVTMLTDGKSRNSSPEWSNSGKIIAYNSTRRNGADTDIYVQSPADPTSERLLSEVKGGGWGIVDWSPDDKQLLVQEYVSINESYLWLFDAQTGERKELTPRLPEGAEKVVGSFMGNPLYDMLFTLSATSPTLINFNYFGVDSVEFISSGGTPHPEYIGFGFGTQFAMDNVVINGGAQVPDAASTIVLLGMALGGIGYLRRKLG